MNKSKFDFAVGGQALIEGVLMRSPNYNIVSVRAENGEIIEQIQSYKNLTSKHKIINLPVIRGVVNMIEMMFIGTKALNFSSSIALADAKSLEKIKTEKNKEKPSILQSISLILSVMFALGSSILLFKFVPLWITTVLSQNFAEINQNYLIFNLIDGLLKSSMFIAYIYLMSLLPDVKRVFMYHGAEHKSIMAYENGLELNVENVSKQTRFHPRCGTSFVLIVFLLSIFVFTIVPKQDDMLLNFALRLAFLPLVAGFSYELLKFSSKHPDHPLQKLISWPGLTMQKLTTQEPTPAMMEVAINSLQLALKYENKALNNEN